MASPKKSKKPAAKKPPAKKPAAKKAAKPKHALQRADYAKPVTSFYAKAPAATRPIILALRDLVEAAAPDATASLKWGMPFYEIGKNFVAAIGAHKAHVNLILPGPAGTYDDPHGHLVGAGKTGKHLRLTALADLPRADVERWLAVAAARAR